jgi:cytidine deaminase
MIFRTVAKSQPEIYRAIPPTAISPAALLSCADHVQASCRRRASKWRRAVMAIDWAALRAAATEAAQRAYAPYSRLRVGAAGQTADGRMVTGCNVENASYGLTLCAECGLVSALHATAASASASDTPPALVAVSVVAGDGQPLVPCGRCRQLLLEAGGPGLLLDTDAGPQELDRLLPGAFAKADLRARRDEPPPA